MRIDSRAQCVAVAVASVLIVVSATRVTRAQSFSSESTGEDGALDFSSAPPNSVIEFDPSTFTPPLDRNRDNVYHFTTITIPANVTVRLTARYVNGPVYWLASGNVTIRGTVDLSGENGHEFTRVPALRRPSTPGSGGYGGGVGGKFASGGVSTTLAQRGAGPGAGAEGGLDSARNADATNSGAGGTFTGNAFLLPLFGGSGGGGGNNPPTSGVDHFGAGGGAGGGAILIASSTAITIDGSIRADGGQGQRGTSVGSGYFASGGPGSGGAIRLAAPVVRGTGSLTAHAGGSNSNRAGHSATPGRVRIEAFRNEFSGGTGNTPVTRASPARTFVPLSPTELRVVRIAGVTLPSAPSGSFEVPDATIETTLPVPVEIMARNVPPGTRVRVHVFSEDGPDQVLESTPLAGSPEASAATASVAFPTGFSRGFVHAQWTQ